MVIWNTVKSYGLVSRLAHWIIAAIIVFLIWLGWWMVGLGYFSPYYYSGPNLHKAVGILVFCLALAKVIWQMISPVPRLPVDLSPMEHMAAKTTHVVLLASMFVIPLTGYLQTTVKGVGVSVFGLFEVPAIYRSPDAVRDLAIDVHYYFSYALLGVIALHAAAAVKHRFIDKRQLRGRMW